jgi:ABC-type ATPase involved in cell division
LFWLCGPAGSGKSTIAHTIAKEWSDSGASFFFSRSRLSLRESRLVFQTIAFQLRIDHPILRAQISCSLEDRTILTANSETQLQKLILDPILHTQANLPERLVIVIDALDECEDDIIAYDMGSVLTSSGEHFAPLLACSCVHHR